MSNKKTGDKILLTVAEVAKFLSVHPWQVRYYIKQGLLKAYRLGSDGTAKRGSRREWRIRSDDLEFFLDRGSNIPDKAKG